MPEAQPPTTRRERIAFAIGDAIGTTLVRVVLTPAMYLSRPAVTWLVRTAAQHALDAPCPACRAAAGSRCTGTVMHLERLAGTPATTP